MVMSEFYCGRSAVLDREQWDDGALFEAPTPQSEGKGFDSLDELLLEIGDELEFERSMPTDRLFVMEDEAISAVEDTSPTFGLDTWDF